MDALKSHYLYPAALFVSKQPCIVNTILGSCVSICLWDKFNEIGGMNHYMLPFWNGQGLPSPKYGNIAINRLIEKLTASGSDPKYLQAKIFGGGEVLSGKDQFHIGKRNIEIAFDFLGDSGIQVTGKSVGGYLGRKIQFITHTGQVKQKFIQKMNIV